MQRELMRHDAIIFDLFGTLVETVTPDAYGTMLAALADDLEVDRDAFVTHWRATLEHRESGRMGGLHDVLRATAHGAGSAPTDADVARAADRWLQIAKGWLVPRADAHDALSAVRSAGLKIGLLSNCSVEVPHLWPSFPLGPHFDATGFSCEIGAMKPDRLVYDAVTSALDVAPGRCLFVGDGGARELTGAANVGMTAVLLRVAGEDHTWFDTYYRQDALEWSGPTLVTLSDLPSLL